MTIALRFKGGKGSGWFAPPQGTHSGEKHRSVGSGKAKKSSKRAADVRKVRLVSKHAEENVGSNALTYYRAGGGAQFPLSITAMDNGVILYNPKSGALYAASTTGRGAGYEAVVGGKGVAHADLAEAIGIPSGDIDDYVRPWVQNGLLNADYRQAAGYDPITYNVSERIAERNVVSASKALLRAGFDPDQGIDWTIGESRTKTRVSDVKLRIQLGQVR